jgi:6-pyruvoyltetrahydropterin/6-carboxytetrahydropterin synthase
VFVLRRLVRFSLPPFGAAVTAGPRSNAFAGWPSSRGIGVYGEFEVAVSGEPDARTGYLVDIADIDAVVRQKVLPALAASCEQQHREQRSIEPASLLPDLARLVAANLNVPLQSLSWHVTPRFVVTVETAMPNATVSQVELRQSFEFSASHRLHSPHFDDATNARIFGKCNNKNGHGHNYRMEVAIAVPLAKEPALALERFEAIVDSTVIRRFDHKHLNSDCPEFASLNPSVEHIAKVCHDLLVEPLRAAGATLRRVTVWETEKTACTYPA